MDVGPRVSRVTPEDRYEFPVLLLATNSCVSSIFFRVRTRAYLCTCTHALASTCCKSLCIDVSNVRYLLLLCVRIIRKYAISNLCIAILWHYVVPFNLNILFPFYEFP